MQPTQVQDVTRNDEVLAVSLELASKSWKVGLDDGKRKSPAVHGVDHAGPAGRRGGARGVEASRLVLALRAWLRGERDRMKVVRVPPVEAEGQRHLVRDRGTLQKEIGQHRDRMRKLLRTA